MFGKLWLYDATDHAATIQILTKNFAFDVEIMTVVLKASFPATIPSKCPLLPP
jgi:hypothetical protein